MKKIIFLVLFFSILVAPAALFAAAFTAPSSVAVAPEPIKIDKEKMEGMITPTLQGYAAHHPDANVRIWSMVILSNIDKVDEQQIFSVPTLLDQMTSNDESVRLVALDAVRQSIDLDDDQWKGVMGPILLNIAKTAKYREVRSLAIQALGKVKDMDKESLSVLPLLFELARDESSEIRRTATGVIEEVLAAQTAK
jgi:hypothetical protein